MNMINSILKWLFNPHQTSEPAEQENITSSKSATIRKNFDGNGYHLTVIRRTGNQTLQKHKHCRLDRPPYRNPRELLREGRLKIGLVGFNTESFVIRPCMEPHDPELVSNITDLPTKVKKVPDRNMPDALRTALQIVGRAPRGRSGIVVITSGNPTTNLNSAWNLVEMAAKWGTAIHVIQLAAHENSSRSLLSVLTTESRLTYGRYQLATSPKEIVDALRGAMDALAPASSMRGFNTGIIVLDCSERMVEAFGDSTRIEMVIAALQSYLQDPLQRPISKNIAIAP